MRLYNGDVVKVVLTAWGLKTLSAKCKEWTWMCVFLQSSLSSPMFIYMFWKINFFVWNRQWGITFSRTFEKFKQQEVLNIFVSGALCKLFKMHSKKFNTPWQVGVVSLPLFSFPCPFTNFWKSFFFAICPNSQIWLSWQTFCFFFSFLCLFSSHLQGFEECWG